jgi:hypothetical protein
MQEQLVQMMLLQFDEKILICHDFVSNENNFLTSGEEITSPKS